MKKYLLGIASLIVAIGFAALEANGKNQTLQYKIIAIQDLTEEEGEIRLITNDAMHDGTVTCSSGSDVCKVVSGSSPSQDANGNFYFVRGTVTETPGQFQLP